MSDKYKRIYHQTNQVEVPHDELTSGNWDLVRVETTIRLQGYQEFSRDTVIWDRQEDKLYIREDGVVMYWAPMSRCTFIRNEDEIIEFKVREYPK